MFQVLSLRSMSRFTGSHPGYAFTVMVHRPHGFHSELFSDSVFAATHSLRYTYKFIFGISLSPSVRPFICASVRPSI